MGNSPSVFKIELTGGLHRFRSGAELPREFLGRRVPCGEQLIPAIRAIR
jgi:hypothetical protein